MCLHTHTIYMQPHTHTPHACTCILIHMYICSYTHTLIHAYMHTLIHTYLMLAYSYVWLYSYTHAHLHIFAYVHELTHKTHLHYTHILSFICLTHSPHITAIIITHSLTCTSSCTRTLYLHTPMPMFTHTLTHCIPHEQTL